MELTDRVLVPIVWKINQTTLKYAYPYFTRKYRKYAYPYFTRQLGAKDVFFLNWGYEEHPPMDAPLAASDEPNRACIQLYYRTATQVDLAGKRVLEVGCGHGGGAEYLTRTLRPACYTGLDLNSAGIAFCRKRHNLAGLEFVQGDAENLPFPDRSFDAVINIESSTLYPRFPRFLAEVARVLRPGGRFLYADFRPRIRIAEWEAALADAPMRMLSEKVINAEVMRAIGMENSWPWLHGLLDVYDRHGRISLRGLWWRRLATMPSRTYQLLQSGRVSYRMYCFAKA